MNQMVVLYAPIYSNYNGNFYAFHNYHILKFFHFNQAHMPTAKQKMNCIITKKVNQYVESQIPSLLWRCLAILTLCFSNSSFSALMCWTVH